MDYGRDVPLVAIRWVVDNTFTNVELAVLSNVSRGWREIVAQRIVDTVSPEGDKKKPSVPPAFSYLLLPSILRHFYSSRVDLQQARASPSKQQHEKEETYCAAWFHPDGIKFEQISIVKLSQEICAEDQQPQQRVVPANSAALAKKKSAAGEGKDPLLADHKFLFTKSNVRLDQITAASTRPKSCPASDDITDWGASVLYQWDGYSEAIDILGPFGYTRRFLRVSRAFNSRNDVCHIFCPIHR